MNHRFYLKIVAFAVIVTGFSIVYSLYSTPRVETIDYTELEVFINTSKIVYEVGEEINATIYLRNPYNYTSMLTGSVSTLWATSMRAATLPRLL